MKGRDKLIIFIVLLMFAFTANAQKQYSVGADLTFGVKSLVNMSGIDKVLIENAYPAIVDNIGILPSGGVNVNFNFGRWGLLYSTYNANINTAEDENGHYYNGTINEFAFGLSYELLNIGVFSLTPYISAGASRADIYLDYLMEDGIVPTALKVEGAESVFTLGVNTYFRIKSWNKAALFLMANTSYGVSSEGRWRFDNMRVDSKDFNMSAFNASGGLAFRYNLKMKKE